jgi:cyclin A
MAARRAALGDLSNVGADAAAQGGVKWDPPPNVRVTRGMRQRALAAEQASAQQPSAGAEPMSVDNAMPPAAAGTALDLAPDPQQCNQYVKDIYGHLRVLEGEFRVSPHFMQSQRDINATMRGILIDWLVEVAEEYRLVPETLHLSVNYIDRFLAQVPVIRSKLQLVGVTCMLIAAKFEEIHPPAVDEFVYISDNTYSRDEILQMESLVLNRINFQLSVATCKAFLSRLLKAATANDGCDSTTAHLSSYLCELTLQEYGFLKYRPSEIAAAAMCLALHTMRLPSWTPLLEQTSMYSLAELAPCVQELWQTYGKAEGANLQAVREKYSHTRFLCVSTLQPPDTLPPGAERQA